MKGGSKAGGFTIIETLIVMAVSGSMFIAVVALISGKQGASQFQLAINDVTQQLQQTIGYVSNGYFSTSNVSCAVGGPAGKPLLTQGSGTIGTSSACLLLGDVIEFNRAPNPDQFIVYPMVGLRLAAGTATPATTFKDANPIAVATGNAPYNNVPDASVATGLMNGLSLAGASLNLPAFAILATPSSISGATGGASGAQQVGLYSVNGTNATTAPSSNLTQINNYTNYASVTSVSICLASGTTNQSGLITIGGSSRLLTVVLAIKGNLTCQ